MSKVTDCPVCGADIKLEEGTEQGELLSCSECGTELEVLNIDPAEVTEAPQEEEDWGE
jgi:alpha-aminoadipate carrier protein LysW